MVQLQPSCVAVAVLGRCLFGKRTDVQDSHDRYANSETGYLLQRLRAHQGVIILESKMLPAGAEGGSMAGLSHVVQFPR